MVLDFSEAFWQIPLHPDERKFFGARLTINGVIRYLLYLRTVQGSRGAPLSWARTAALLMRLTFSFFDESTIRMLCFVDDPLVVLRRTESERLFMKALIILVWEALGFPLSYSKGQQGHESRGWAATSPYRITSSQCRLRNR